jgi:cytochrome P450
MPTEAYDASGFDHFDPALKEDPYPTYEGLRSACPVARSDRHGGYWVLARYQDVYDALRDPITFSSFPNGVPTSSRSDRRIPLEIDPPEHGKYRQLLAPYFSPRAADEQEDAVRKVAVELISKFERRGRCELVEDFARPLPTLVFTGMMGLPMDHAGLFYDWEERIIRPPHENAAEVRATAVQEMYDYIDEMLIQRRSEPARDDLIGVLLASELDGRPLTDTELRELCWLLIEAGLDTVQAAISNSIITLCARPDLQDRLRRDPAVIPTAIEEFLRYESHVSMGRTLTRDTEFAGAKMRAGDRVLVVPGAADRDPAQFDEPDAIGFDREDKRHLAFGAGPHRCLGSHLARLEMRVAFEELHRRLGPYRIAAGERVERADPGFVRSTIRVPLEFDVVTDD